jgi:hypothetical protein
VSNHKVNCGRIPGTLLAISIIFTYTRLIWWITPLEHRNSETLWLPFRATSLIIAGAQLVAEVMMTIGTGQVVKITIPRLVSSGAVLEMLVWMSLTVLVARFTLISRRWPMDVETRQGSLELGLALVGSSVLLSVSLCLSTSRSTLHIPEASPSRGAYTLSSRRKYLHY